MSDYIKLVENEDWIVEYDPFLRKYRVSYFVDGHFKDEVIFYGHT